MNKMKSELLIETTIFDVHPITDYATIHLHREQPHSYSLINEFHQRFCFEDLSETPDEKNHV